MMHESSDGLAPPYRHLQGIDHPTILGEWVSSMKARWRKPSRVGTFT
jgi:hypothetical protein